MQNIFKSIVSNIKAFFRRQQWKEVFIFIFFLMLAAAFWLLQNLQQNYERKIDLPVRYKNVPPNLIVYDSNPKTLHIVLKDKGTTLLYYSWKSNFAPIDLSVEELLSRSDSSSFVSHSLLESIISKQLISSTSIVSINPDDFYIKHDSLRSVYLPVAANINMQTKQGFQLSDSISIEPSKVRIYAVNSILDTLKEIKTKLVKLENVSKTKEVTAHLQLPNGVNSDQETVKLTIPVEEFTEKRMQVAVLCSDIPDNYALRVFPSSVEIVCNIPLSHFKDLSPEEIEIRIPFKEFENNQRIGKLSLELTKKPSWMRNSVIVPDEVEFIIEQVKHD